MHKKNMTLWHDFNRNKRRTGQIQSQVTDPPILRMVPKSAQWLLFCWLMFTAGCQTASVFPQEPKGRDVAEIIGSTHVMSNYYFGDKDSLNEGADRLLEIGTKVIKVWFYMGHSREPQDMYIWNSEWPEADNLVEIAKQPYWRELFDKPFKTYILAVMEMVPQGAYYWKEHFTPEQEAEVQRQTYELACYLLTEYQGTGKTFVFSNHETDWHLVDDWGNWDAVAPDAVYERAVRWFGARQRGVEQARRDVGSRGVQVFHAGEVVHVVKSMQDGRPSMVTKILPHVQFDLISYSCWDATIIGGVQEKKLLTEALDFIAEHALQSAFFGRRNVFIGEYGVPENEYGEAAVLQVTQNVVEAGLEWGCPYIVYWQLYCNEPVDRDWKNRPKKDNAESRGFWLIRNDGSKTKVYDYFTEMLKHKAR